MWKKRKKKRGKGIEWRIKKFEDDKTREENLEKKNLKTIEEKKKESKKEAT